MYFHFYLLFLFVTYLPTYFSVDYIALLYHLYYLFFFIITEIEITQHVTVWYEHHAHSGQAKKKHRISL